MSFLNQLKQQAQTLQTRQGDDLQQLDANTQATEAACKTVWHYFMELPRQLNVIEPAAASLSLDGKTPWPPMKQTDFRFDARKKTLRGKEVFEYLALGWQLEPQQPAAAGASGSPKGRVSVNFPPDLERVERRLRVGQVRHDRRELRHPDTNRLQSIVFEHDMVARASVRMTPDHDKGSVEVRLAAVGGLEVVSTRYTVAQLNTAALDELAKLIVGQPSRFL
ncbi:MAG: hypothetical protein Q8K50_16680 [Hydrogenophaga sp.]|jgi:hypothetical protein|uniref:hypothetical protein n=1 Tax=Hydrogenophaga sp. TaxID=1904254 RepID=UPI00271F5120|nr:hypothetical protein [Hydrogenophaga sp.]MDO9571968.1 hypothetical protein [Hydrogenophaga sp.]MDP2095499.1 hypothetical protein [Hydrogenophaga sp.]MDP3373744.1 hypothetical protein [Hydrogenophaga sp.]